MPPKAHFSIWYFLLALLLFTYLQQYLISGKVEAIPYSQFKQCLAEGALSKLTIGTESIDGTLKGKDNKSGEEFTTVRGNDPDFVKKFDEHKVSYFGYCDSKLLSTVLSWIIPIGIFFLIWRFTMKKMGPGMGVMSFAKRKAKLFAENETEVTSDDVAGDGSGLRRVREIGL